MYNIPKCKAVQPDVQRVPKDKERHLFSNTQMHKIVNTTFSVKGYSEFFATVSLATEISFPRRLPNVQGSQWHE